MAVSDIRNYNPGAEALHGQSSITAMHSSEQTPADEAAACQPSDDECRAIPRSVLNPYRGTCSAVPSDACFRSTLADLVERHRTQ